MMTDLTDDLQNHLTDLETFADIEYANRLIERSLEALSPVRPDELEEVLRLCQTPRTRDLLERQGREIQLRDEMLAEAANTVEILGKRIEALEAENKKYYRGLKQALEWLTGDFLNAHHIKKIRAALQENK